MKNFLHSTRMFLAMVEFSGHLVRILRCSQGRCDAAFDELLLRWNKTVKPFSLFISGGWVTKPKRGVRGLKKRE